MKNWVFGFAIVAVATLPSVVAHADTTKTVKAPKAPKRIDFMSLPEGAPEPTYSLDRPGTVRSGDTVDSFNVHAYSAQRVSAEPSRRSLRGRLRAERERRVAPTPITQPNSAQLVQVGTTSGPRCLSQLGLDNATRTTTLNLSSLNAKDVFPVRAEWLVMDGENATLEIQDAWVDVLLGAAKEASRQSIALKLVALGPEKEPVYAFRSGSRTHLVFPVDNNASVVLDSGGSATSICSVGHVTLEASRSKSVVANGTFTRVLRLPWDEENDDTPTRNSNRMMSFFASASQTASDDHPVVSVVVSNPSFDAEAVRPAQKRAMPIQPMPPELVD